MEALAGGEWLGESLKGGISKARQKTGPLITEKTADLQHSGFSQRKTVSHPPLQQHVADSMGDPQDSTYISIPVSPAYLLQLPLAQFCDPFTVKHSEMFHSILDFIN